MAGAGGRRNTSLGVKAKNATADRAALIKEINAYYIKMRKKHGASKISLNFSNSKTSGAGGTYTYKTDKKGAKIVLYLPSAAQWAKSYNSNKAPRMSATTILAEAKKTINHELAHHVDVLSRAHHTRPKKGEAHGESFERAAGRVGSIDHRARGNRKPRPALGKNRTPYGAA